MSVSLSVSMMAHPKRAQQIEQILARLDRDDVTVVWDEKQSRWDTGRRAMLAFDQDCTHHCVIQDDVLVCRDLLAGLTAALEHVPDDVPVCGYIGRVRPYAEMVSRASRRAKIAGASWMTMKTLNWGPLVVVPTAVVPAMIEHCDSLRNIPNYDRRLSRFFELQQETRIWYTWPSLVDHADGPSLVKGRIGTARDKGQTARIAHTFIGEDASALDVDWSGPVVEVHPPRREDHRSKHRLHAGPEHVVVELDEPDGRVLYRNRSTGQVLRLPPTSPRVRRLRGVSTWELVEG